MSPRMPRHARTRALALVLIAAADPGCRATALHRSLSPAQIWAPPTLTRSDHFIATDDYYPPAAKRVRVYGVVSVAFSVDARGSVIKRAIVYSDSDKLNFGALAVAGSLRYNVPDDWTTRGGEVFRYILNISFELSPCEPPFTRYYFDEPWLTVCGMRDNEFATVRGEEGIQ